MRNYGWNWYKNYSNENIEKIFSLYYNEMIKGIYIIKKILLNYK